jgi:hypothetical protein
MEAWSWVRSPAGKLLLMYEQMCCCRKRGQQPIVAGYLLDASSSLSCCVIFVEAIVHNVKLRCQCWLAGGHGVAAAAAGAICLASR